MINVSARWEAFKRLIDSRVKLHESYQAVFGTPDGELVLQHILKHGHVFETSFVRGDPHETALREGERRLALSILRHVCRDHAEFQRMAEEHYKTKSKDEYGMAESNSG